MQFITHRSFPRAILHVDGDSFFASCEIAKNPSLRGKPVITGKERGIVSSMSYEAKRCGITRAMKLSEVRKICPAAVILPSDYETYSLYSRRMYRIIERYTPEIEEYSIDECFADLTGMRRVNRMPYERMAMMVKHDLDTELGMTFSVGLSLNKVLAKVASKWKKPSGLTIIPGYSMHLYLSKTPIEKIWGIGPNTAAYLRKHGLETALDFAMADRTWVRSNLSKPFREIYAELNGGFVYPLVTGTKHDYASISKTRTFTPPSTDREFVFSQLSKNVENACIKMRRHGLETRKFAFFLKNQDFRYAGMEIRLDQAVSSPPDILFQIRMRFGDVFRPLVPYRATGIVLMDLDREASVTLDLFGRSEAIGKAQKIFEAVDRIDARYGKHTVFLGSSMKALRTPLHAGYRGRGDQSERRLHALKGERGRKRLAIPLLGQVI